MKHILIVNSPSNKVVYGKLLHGLSAIEPPVWAGLIAQHIAQHTKFRVEILDAEAEGLTIEETAKQITDRDPLLAVFCIYGHQPSASTQCLPAAAAVAALVTKTPTIAVGTHPSALPKQTLLETGFSFVCQGEGPITVVRLAQVLAGEPDQHIFCIPGLWHWDITHTPVGNNPATNIPSNRLDEELPGQAWWLLDMKKYRAHNWHLWSGSPQGGYASVQTSLGCPFRCSFCCINAPFGDAGIRYWSPEFVVDQITHLVRGYGITNIKIPDEMFCLNPKRVKEICTRIIDSGVADKLNMWAYARIDTVRDEEMLRLMRRAGFLWLGIGIESASEHVRHGVAKGKFGEQDIITAIRQVRLADINVAANYIFGLPDDTYDSMKETLDLACVLNTEMANFYCAMAYPGSKLHDIAKSNGWKLPEDPGGPGWLGYSQHAYVSLPLRTKTLTAEEVLDFRDSAWMDYFSREEYRDMMLSRFGPGILSEIDHMVSRGRPPRKHRDRKP